MSLEDSIAKLTAAVAENTAALANIKAAATANAGKPATAGTAGATTKPTIPTDDNMREKFGDYIAKASDEADRNSRRENVKAILAKFEAKGATSIPSAKRVEAVGYIDQLVAGETPDFLEAAGGDGDDLLG